jgi:hypothetical protein
MSIFFVIVMVISAIILLGWMLIPVAVMMLDSEEEDMWNWDPNNPRNSKLKDTRDEIQDLEPQTRRLW